MRRSYAQDYIKCIRYDYFLKQLGGDDFVEMLSSWRLSKTSGLEVPHYQGRRLTCTVLCYSVRIFAPENAAGLEGEGRVDLGVRDFAGC
jgi:hypothetical protein